MKNQQLTIQFNSVKAAQRLWLALQLLHEVGILPRTVGFKAHSRTPRQITLYTGEAP